jgi:hypothetical protein
MTGGGSSRSRILRSSVLPSVSSTFRVSSGRRRGSLDQAVLLISTTTCATCSPRNLPQPTGAVAARAHVPGKVDADFPTHPNDSTGPVSGRPRTAGEELDWLNKDVFVSVGGRSAAGVIYETYLVG